MKREYKRPTDWDSFVLYKSQFEPISDLPDEALGRLFRHLFRWQIDGEANPEPDVAMAFKFIVNQFRIDDMKRMAKCLINQENGKSGGRPKKTERFDENRTVAKKPNGGHNENDNENVNDNGNVEGNGGNGALTLPFPDNPEFVETWNELRATTKWKHKTVRALKMALNQLAKYDVRFSIILMQTAISGNYQGVAFADTPTRYEQWKRLNPQQPDNTPVEVITDIDQLYKNGPDGNI